MPDPVPALRYLDVEDATTIAGQLPQLAAFIAASDEEKAAALNQASADVDLAMLYHGQKADPDQPRAFPRMGDGEGAATGDAPAVPDEVLQAVVHQANAILSETRESRLALQHDGVVYSQTGSDAESYKATPGPGVPTGLCRRAWMLLRRFRLRGGQLL